MIKEQRAEEIVLEREVNRVVAGDFGDCCYRSCLSTWRTKKFRGKLARAVVYTERRAYAKMDRFQRLLFYERRIRQGLDYVTTVEAETGEQYLAGKLV